MDQSLSNASKHAMTEIDILTIHYSEIIENTEKAQNTLNTQEI